MLEEILMHLNNWYVAPDGIHAGEYSIAGGSITLPFLVDGQYFRIFGSKMNDGLYQYPASDLTDEKFTGTVWELRVPKSLVTLSDEIKEWVAKNEPSVFTAESFGGYSYSKATGPSGAPMGWQDVFRAQLNPYRKIRETGPVRGQRPVRPYYRPWNPDYPLGGEM